MFKWPRPILNVLQIGEITMKKKHLKYQSPFEKMNGESRFELATKLANDFHLEPSQVLFAYLQTVTEVSENNQNDSRIEKLQPEIDAAFGQTLARLRANERQAD